LNCASEDDLSDVEGDFTYCKLG